MGPLAGAPARIVTLRVDPARRVAGSVRVPPDKSISHRAALVAAVANGESVLENYLPSLDCLATLECLRRLGVEVHGPDASGSVRVVGRPLAAGGFSEPGDVLDVGNSGTTIRLLSGLLAAHPVYAVLTGDASIRRRPMQRIIDPLTRMGARVWARRGGLAPLAIQGGPLTGLHWRTPVASAQVKSAVLLAGLQARGATSVEEPLPTRDHTERMLQYFGARVRWKPGWAQLEGPQELSPRTVRVPADPSSAAFVWAAAAMLEGSAVQTPDVNLNPGRIGILQVLREMGARVEVRGLREEGGEPRGDVEVAYGGQLQGVVVRGERSAQLIDELPVLVVLGALARGTTVIRDAQELRHKESNRIDDLAGELKAVGVEVETLPDGFVIHGPQRPKGGRVRSHGDHRVAMALAVAGLAAREPVWIEGAECIQTSFPGFASLFDALAREGGGRVVAVDATE